VIFFGLSFTALFTSQELETCITFYGGGYNRH